MTGVVGKLRSFSRALSSADDEKSSGGGSSILNRSSNFLSKLGVTGSQSPQLERRCKTLLVIDSSENDWVNVFQGKSLHNKCYDIRVEQAEFSELRVVSSSERGVTVSMRMRRNNAVIARSFRPDFVLIRQYVSDVEEREKRKHFLLGLIHGNVPSMNPLRSSYIFLDKPIVYAELTIIKRRLGAESFPLIDQNYYHSSKEMVLPPSLPIVVKTGSEHSGLGKVCVASPRGFQDVASMLAVSQGYATTEPFLDGKYDIRILKIGGTYKVYKRRSLSDSWKTNCGSAAVEEIALTERYKFWADECSGMFGGLEFLCVEAIHTNDDREFIVEVNDTLRIMCSDTKHDQMHLIGNAVLRRMEILFQPHLDPQVKTPTSSALFDAMNVASGSSLAMQPTTNHHSSKDVTPRSNTRASYSTPASPMMGKRADNGLNANGGYVNGVHQAPGSGIRRGSVSGRF